MNETSEYCPDSPLGGRHRFQPLPEDDPDYPEPGTIGRQCKYCYLTVSRRDRRYKRD